MTSDSRCAPSGPDGSDLPRGLRRLPGPSHRRVRHWFDTFDRRLLAAGVELYVEVEGRTARVVVTGGAPGGGAAPAPGPAGPAEATGDGATSAAAEAGLARARALGLGDLPEPVRIRLAGLTAGRALVALASARTTVQEDVVVDSEDKTVCRLEVSSAEPDVRSIVVRPLRGYEDHSRRVAAALGATGSGLLAGVLAATGAAEAPGSAPPGRDLRPGMPAPAAVASMVGHLLETAQANVAGTLARYDEEFLHDLRVAVRRSRTAVKLARGVVDEAPRARLASELKWLGDVTTPARDLDVHVDDLPDLVGAVSGELRDATAPFSELLVARREAAHRTLNGVLRSARFRELMAGAPALLGAISDPAGAPGPPGMTTAELAARCLDQTFTRVVKRGRRITPESPDEAVHDLRKRAKELRYALEFFSGLLPGEEAGTLVKDLKGLQDVLGRFNDTVVQRALLREAGAALNAAGVGSDTLLALGEMSGQLIRSGRRAREELGPRFTRLRRWEKDGSWAALLSGLG